MDIEAGVRTLEEQIEPLERLHRLFTASLGEPAFVETGGGRGFRYTEPDVRHFCLVKSARALSTLHACFLLARRGHTQEIATLVRTIVECTNHIEFIIDIDASEEHRKAVKKYLEAFFADWRREPHMAARRLQITQGAVHAQLGKTLDGFADKVDESENRPPARHLFTNVYRIYSNYVHANYPECMDLYGGRPGRFHVKGYAGTPKIGEGLEVLQTFVVTVMNTFVLMIQQLNLRRFVEADPIVDAWFRRRLNKSAQ